MAGDGHEQRHHAERPDAADADDLDRAIDKSVTIEQRPTIVGKRLAIPREARLHDLQGRIGDRRVWMEQRRRIVVDAGTPFGVDRAQRGRARPKGRVRSLSASTRPRSIRA